jgi:hypothetical protein
MGNEEGCVYETEGSIESDLILNVNVEKFFPLKRSALEWLGSFQPNTSIMLSVNEQLGSISFDQIN